MSQLANRTAFPCQEIYKAIPQACGPGSLIWKEQVYRFGKMTFCVLKPLKMQELMQELMETNKQHYGTGYQTDTLESFISNFLLE